MVSQSKSFVGTGVYSIPDAARIVGAPTMRVRRWLSESNGVVNRYFSPEAQAISFMELMELHFIKMFREEGVTLQVIRRIAKRASERYDSDYPFAVKRFDTDGKTIFATLAKESTDEERIEDLNRGQYVFKTVIRPFFRKLDYSQTDIARYWPMSKRKKVVIDPKVQFGRPIDPDSGVPTRALYQATKAGKGQSEAKVADWYKVSVAAVRAAVEYERTLQK